MFFSSYLQGKATADISCQSYIKTCTLKNMVDQRSGCGLAIGTSNANHYGIGIASSQLYLRDDGDLAFTQFHNERRIIRNTRTLHHFIGIQNFLFTMVSFFPFNVVFIHLGLVLVLNASSIRHKGVEAFQLSKYGSSRTTLGSSQNHYSFLFFHNSFNSKP